MRPMPRRAIQKQQGLIRRPVRTRMDAAAELGRLEHDREQLARQIDELVQRRTTVADKLKLVEMRAAWLLEFLKTLPAGDQAPQMVQVTLNVPVTASMLKPQGPEKRRRVG
jgi:phosphoglycerate-specific signal transduction histidine kinase